MTLLNSNFGCEKLAKILSTKRTIYFAGIGGISMSGLAEVLQDGQHIVSGCDREESDLIRYLRSRNIPVCVPFPAVLPEDTEILVYTLALSPEDPLLQQARRRGIPVISRAELLGSICLSYKERIAVAGSHGKSTVTAMTAAIFSAAGKRPTVLCGAVLPGRQSGYQPGDRDVLIYEACEYRNSFLYSRPTTAVLLNAEADHPDFFQDKEAILQSFARFLSLPGVKRQVVEKSVTSWYPTVEKTIKMPIIVDKNEEKEQRQIGTFTKELHSFSTEEAADITAEQVSFQGKNTSFVPVLGQRKLPKITLPVPGRYNLANALAAIGVANSLGIGEEVIQTGLKTFTGVAGRMEFLFSYFGAAVYRDYAHHPTEIRAALTGARAMTKGRLLVLFQSHTYSRTKAYYPDFLSALKLSDILLITDIFPARETDTLGLSGQKMAEDAGGIYVPDVSEAAIRLASLLRPGDLCLLLGAGNAAKTAPILQQIPRVENSSAGNPESRYNDV